MPRLSLLGVSLRSDNCQSPSVSTASPSIHVQAGSTPLLLAAQNGHTEVACFLLDNGSSAQEQNYVSTLREVLPSSLELLVCLCVLECVFLSSWNA